MDSPQISHETSVGSDEAEPKRGWADLEKTTRIDSTPDPGSVGHLDFLNLVLFFGFKKLWFFRH